jgi:DNA-binding IclR family transcriptional regulator
VTPRPPRSSSRAKPDGATASPGLPAAYEGTSEETGERANYHVAALTRGLVILRVLSGAGSPLGLAALQEKTTIPKSTLVRLLSVLAGQDYVVRVDETPSFWLGPSVMPLAEAYASALDVTTTAGDILERLAASCGQTANVAILDGADVVHLCVVEPDRPIRFRSSTGSRDGAYRTGLGKVLLAFTALDELDEHLPAEPFPGLTRRTITKRRDLVTELEHVRRAGYAFDNEEGDTGVCCLAVPIRRGSDVVAALSVTGPTGEFAGPAREALLPSIREAALNLERRDQFQHALQIVRRSLR